MQKIFIGMLLILLDLNLNIGGSRIDLLPDFIGYFSMARGMFEMIQESQYFEKGRIWAVVLGIYTCLLFAADLFGISESLGVLAAPSVIITTVLFLYTSYWICEAVLEIETNRNEYLGGDELMKKWKLLAVIDIITGILVLLQLLPFMAIILIIADFIIIIIFLVCFKNVKNDYYTLPPHSR